MPNFCSRQAGPLKIEAVADEEQTSPQANLHQKPFRDKATL